jgi:membrane protein
VGNVTGWRPFRLGLAVQKRYGADSAGYLTAVITYYAFFSLFPLLLLGLAVVGFILAGDPVAQGDWVDSLTDTVPGLKPIIGENLDAIVDARAGVGIVALAGLLWTGTGLVEAAGWALGRVFRVPDYQGFLKKKAWSIGSLIGLGLLWLASTALVGVAGTISLEGVGGVLAKVGGVLLGFSLDMVLFLVAYRILVQRRGPPFRQLWAGALLAAVGWFVLKLAGSWYATHTVGRASAVYGAFAAVIGVLVLLYFSARVFLYGAELNAVLIEERGGGPVDPSEEGPKGEVEVSKNGQEKPPAEQSTLELIRSIASDTGTLVRKEIELARREVTEGISARVKAVAAMAVAGVVALIALIFLGSAGAEALDEVMPDWAARLVVAGFFLVVAALAAVFGKARLKKPSLSPEETKRTVKEDVEWAKAQLKR